MKLAFLLGSPYELAIIAAVVVLMFGGPKIAGMGKSFAQSIREFKETTRSKEVLPGEDQSVSKSLTTPIPSNSTPTHTVAATKEASIEDAPAKSK